MNQKLEIGEGVFIGKGEPLAFIGGPCVIESRDHTLSIAEKLKKITSEIGIPFIFKASYDKANRTSQQSFRGPGLDEGLDILEEVREELNIPVLTDVHTESEAQTAAGVVDIVQIPAFLCRQTSILQAAGEWADAVLIKKGQFLAPEDMKFAVEKVANGGCEKIMLCERGTCFGYRDLVVDFRSLELMRDIGYPVVFDGTHSVQIMGGAGGSSSGNRRFIPMLARAAVAAGVDAVFLECHEAPERAPSDGPNMIELDQLPALLKTLVNIPNACCS